MIHVGSGFRSFERLEPFSGNTRAVVVAAMFATFAATAGVCRTAMGQIPCRYEVAAIIQAPPGPIHASPTIPMAISPNGLYVVGYYNFDGVGGAKPWFWSQATGFISLAMPPGFYEATPQDVNDHRKIAVTGWKDGPGQRGYIHDFDTGQFTEIEPLPGGVWSGCNAINNNDEACGYRSIGPGTQPQTAFVFRQGVMTDLGLIDGESTSALALNDAGSVTGTMSKRNVVAPFIWGPTSLIPLGTVAGMYTTPWAINSDNVVVGHATVPYQPPEVVPQAFRWQAGLMTQLGTLPGHARSRANDISDSGLIVGLSRPFSNGGDRAFVFAGDGPMIDLNDLVDPASPFIIREASGVSTTGVVIGYGFASGTSTAILVMPFEQVGDANHDCAVNVTDLLAVISFWGTANTNADLNADGVVNVTDLLLVISNWGA